MWGPHVGPTLWTQACDMSTCSLQDAGARFHIHSASGEQCFSRPQSEVCRPLGTAWSNKADTPGSLCALVDVYSTVDSEKKRHLFSSYCIRRNCNRAHKKTPTLLHIDTRTPSQMDPSKQRDTLHIIGEGGSSTLAITSVRKCF